MHTLYGVALFPCRTVARLVWDRRLLLTANSVPAALARVLGAVLSITCLTLTHVKILVLHSHLEPVTQSIQYMMCSVYGIAASIVSEPFTSFAAPWPACLLAVCFGFWGRLQGGLNWQRVWSVTRTTNHAVRRSGTPFR